MTARIIPSIEHLRRREAVGELERRYGGAAVVDGLREESARLRAALQQSDVEHAARDLPHSPDDASIWIEQRLRAQLDRRFRFSLRPVINATGVIIHTNLGRAPLPDVALRRMAEVGAGHVNLEYDLSEGRRGARDTLAEALICRLTGAEAAVVANNNAAATMLMLSALAGGREVVISRGELVEIGGGFRIPDILAQSGASLREVGTTNRTRVADYAAAIGPRTALILRVHPSNFRIEGFTERPDLPDLVRLGRQFDVPVAEDLGSGLLIDPADLPAHAAAALHDEPQVQASLAAGADVVCFSGDKLLGGPQAGIMAGRREALHRIRRHPLMRAVRVDKLTYAALEATLLEYAAGRAAETLPVWQMIVQPVEAIEQRVRALAARLDAVPGLRIEIVDDQSTIGGGSAPGAAIPTKRLALTAPRANAAALDEQLRRSELPVISRIVADRLVLDLRSVPQAWDARLADTLLGALQQPQT
jgi:L-seryl-tRNA(Ser) seleniumtransferase